MRLTMQVRKAVTKMRAAAYRAASKKQKGRMLDEFVEMTGYNRVYAAQVLRGHGRKVAVAPGVLVEGSVRAKRPAAPRQRHYGEDVHKALVKVWKIMDYICGKRLAASLPEVVPRLISQGELRVSRTVKEQLMQICASSIDRLLAPERKKFTLKGRSGTKPGTLLQHQIPVRTFSEWNDAQPGFVEIDLVGHDGGSVAGEYCQTLDATDVATGWSEQVAVPSKAQCWVFEAIIEIRQRLPFELLGIDSDNGSEFINQQLTKYCVEEKLTFTRSRAGRKNDNCYVEQKNWSIVRRFAGYGRFESREACQLLNDLYVLLRDYVNFFMPSMKLIEKTRDGARVKKRYDAPKTPYQRVLEAREIDPKVKRRLKRYYASLNPAALQREIGELQKKLETQTARLQQGKAAPKPSEGHPWRRFKLKEKTG